MIITAVWSGWYFLYSNHKDNSPVPTDTNRNQTTTSSPSPIDSRKDITTVGQFFMIGHWADTPPASTTALVKEYQPSGVLIMSAPGNPDEIKTWVKEWNKVAKEPLFIAIDQEGGPVSRLKGNRFIATGQREITDERTAYEIGLKRGKELTALGINMNLAPILDTATQTDSFLYERTFPEPNTAAVLAGAMIRGFKTAGVIAVVKHFPGHPDNRTDSHTELPQVNITRRQLPDFAAPFIQLISNHQAEALMTGHILFPQIDTKPTTLSAFFLTDFLRQKLNYTGLIITDDIIMDAIDKTWDSNEASVMALQAGADIVLFAAEPEKVETAIKAVEEAVSAGLISPAKLMSSQERILKLKEKYQLTRVPQ